MVYVKNKRTSVTTNGHKILEKNCKIKKLEFFSGLFHS